MKCLVLQSFAGPVYNSGVGKEIDLPKKEAEGLAFHGIVKILEDYQPPAAYEIPEVETKQTRIIKPKRR